MQLNKVVKEIMLALTILTVAACSSKKGNEKTTDTENNVVSSDTALTSEHLASQQIQDLQNNNIVYFGFDKYDITIEYAQLLDQHASFLRAHPSIKITVEGHTDEKGTPEYNIALGERRANAVKIYLQSKGVNGEQIAIVSYGKEKPAIEGNEESVYAQNRRAVVVY